MEREAKQRPRPPYPRLTVALWSNAGDVAVRSSSQKTASGEKAWTYIGRNRSHNRTITGKEARQLSAVGLSS